MAEPIAGVYEKLITQDVRDELARFEAAGWTAIDAEVSAESAPHVLARYIGDAVGRSWPSFRPRNASKRRIASLRRWRLPAH